MTDVRLIPYQVEEIIEELTNIPEGVQMIEAPELWDKADKGKGNVVAIIDTGCQTNHPDLEGRVIAGRNFTTDYNSDPDNYLDNNGHGTHVAGTIAAIGRDNRIAGVAPETNLLILKVLTKQGSGRMEWIVDAIRHAVDWTGPDGEKVKVISMSLGGPQGTDELHDVIKYAVDNHVCVVCAAGNEGDNQEDTDEFSYPGAYNEVIQVGAVDFQRRIARFTNTNDEIDLVAPGVNVLSTFPDNRYAKLSGTSMSTPHVSGALVLLNTLTAKEFGRFLTEPELYAQLIRRTTPLDYSKKAVGNGLLTLGLVDKLESLFNPYTKMWEKEGKSILMAERRA
ncbi:S8 family peptidase [Pseudalkalibacillus salsuginis]|uniref:S8 family peptidase n=1 Tax=Pseudalkalibacillus salsuginis TaxID=2910972 RepID=UPI001F428124|nr:S8 family peptidase [Pseudalkalibacillus salsuginis]MCF6409950.1 S8 family peptidase [Pseudalkalibacillus salsuginis]